MAIPPYLVDRQQAVFKESSAIANQVGLVVINPDGTSISAGGGGGTASSFGAAFPGSGTAAGFTDGTNMQAGMVYNTKTGGGSEYDIGVNLRISGAGGSIEAKGQQLMASSLPVVIASNQSAFSVTANAGTNLNTSALALDATLTGGTQKSLVYDGVNTIFTSTHPGYVQFGSSQSISGSVSLSASTSATGELIYLNTALTATAVAVKASAGNLYGWHVQNTNTSDIFIQIFNLVTGGVTLGVTSPNMVLVIPAAASASISGILDDYLASPIGFGTAITIAATTTATGSTAPGNALLANFFYI